MIRLYLIRHGQSTWNAQRRWQGLSDPPLDDVGRGQAHRLAERLQGNGQKLLALYASPLQRARETADIIGEAVGVSVVFDDRLKERDVGAFTGLTIEQVGEQYPDALRRMAEADESLVIPGEEDAKLFRVKVATFFDEIVARHGEGPIGVVSHGGTLGAYLNHLIGLPSRFFPFRFGNTSLSIVDVDPARPRIVLLNDICHTQENGYDYGE
ncbi:MAG: histidine phosphatase family protein [Chloroflexi bacterium]|nr:histidine phosphatase family protein [Chloroflexota bacterium]